MFNIEINCRFFKSRNTYGFVVRDKNIIRSMHELGFPYGNKSAIIKIPNKILNSKDPKIITNFLRGLFDTDVCLHFWRRNTGNYCRFKKTHHYYPIVMFSTISKNLNDEIKILLKNLGFTKIGNYTYESKNPNEKLRYTLRLYGEDKTNLFFKKIGSKNPVKLSRFLVWKKLGYCSANTSLKERLEILKNPLNSN